MTAAHAKTPVDRRAGRRVVSRPEKGAQKKSWRKSIPVCVVYPNSYYVGMSNLAIHLLYGTLNGMTGVVCERAFWEPPGETRSVESGYGLASFRILFFSLSYELDYVNIPALLMKAGIAPFARDRREGSPLVVAGGICVMANPEPLHAFFDLFILGDVESTVAPFVEAYRLMQGAGRAAALGALEDLPWVYRPESLQVYYNDRGTIGAFEPAGFAVAVAPHCGEGLGRSAISAEDTEFSGMYLFEGTRGCPSRCPFCLLGNSYRFRHEEVAPPDEATGAIGIVGGGVSFHPHLEENIRGLQARGLSVHLPSLRIDAVPMRVIELLKDDIKTLTFGIEAGTERLRRFVGKPMRDEDILSKIAQILSVKPFNLKLYFMIGLYGERMEDIDAIAVLVKQIHHLTIRMGAPKGAVGSITTHVSPFVPKPWTPFQWLPMEEPAALKEKINRLRRNLKKIENSYFTHESVKFSFLQAVLARGDRRTNDLIVDLASGADLQRLASRIPVNPNFYALREREEHELFPWDFIEREAGKEQLYRRLAALLLPASDTGHGGPPDRGEYRPGRRK